MQGLGVWIRGQQLFARFKFTSRWPLAPGPLIPAFQYDFQKKYTVIPAPTSTTNQRIHACGNFCA